MTKYAPYPRTLYRQRDDVPDHNEFDGVRCELLTVTSEDEEKAAKADGWHNSPAEAGKPVKSAKALAKPKKK